MTIFPLSQGLLKKRLKIFGFSLLILVAVLILLNYQAKRIVIGLIESNSDDRVKVRIGRVNIQPINGSIRLRDVFVLVRDSNSESFKRINIDRMFLDVASLWSFFLGGTLIIEKFECEGGHLTIFNAINNDPTSHSFDLTAIIERIKSDAIRFRIEDIVFRDMNLSLTKDSTRAPTTVQHIYARAQNLYLSTDSMVRKKPIVEFSLPRQIITLPSELTFGFDSLSFSTTDNSVQVLNLAVKSPPADLHNVYYMHSDMVRLAHVNFESLYQKGHLVIDSVFLGKSTISVDWLIDKKKKKDSVTQQGIPALPHMDIHTIAFNEIVSDVVIRNDSIQNTFKIEHASLTVDQFRHRPDSSHVIYAPAYNLLITKYATSLGGNNASISFDTIQIQKHSLALLNFSYRTAGQKQPLLLAPRFELKLVDWYELLINRKLMAEAAMVFDPTIVATIRKNKNTASGPVDNFMIVQSLSDFLQVNLFSLKNATAFVKVPDSHLDIMMRGYNTTFNVQDLINSGSVNAGLDAILDFSFQNLRVTNPDYRAAVENFKFSKRGFTVSNLTYSKSDILFSLVGLKLGSISWSESSNSLSLDGVDWKNLNTELKESEAEQPQTNKSKERNTPNIYVGNIRGGNLSLRFQNDDLRVRAELDHLNLNSFSLTDSIFLNGIDVKGNSLLFDTRLNEVRIGSYVFSDTGGTLHDIGFNRITGDYLNVSVGKLMLTARLPDFARQKYIINSLTLDNIKSRVSKRDNVQRLDIDADSRLTASNLIYKNKNISVESLFLDVGPFNVTNEIKVKDNMTEPESNSKAGARRFRIGTDTLVQKKYSVNGLKQSANRLKLSSPEDSDTSIFTKERIRLKSEGGGIKFDLGSIQSTTRDSSLNLNARIKSIQFSEVDFATDKIVAWINHGSINNLVVDSDRAKDVWNVLEDNYPTAAIRNMKASIETNGNLIRFDRLDYDPLSMSGMVRQFEFRPLKEKTQFLDDSFYQTNYMDTRIESVAFTGFNVKRFLKDTVIQLANIRVESPSLEIGRDKTKTFFATAVKPLPTNAFQKLKLGFKIDTLKVSNGKISYTEKSRITGKEGTINFSQLDALVRNVKNIDLSPNDSLYIRASTQFMDSANVRLRVRESYRDTLAGFVLTTQVSPFNTSILNKALVPMVSVDFKSGLVDTLYMKAIGREYLALGSMKFLYHDLKVEFLDKNDTSRHSLKNQLLKFAANTFVVKSNNNDRTGKIYYERDRNRAVFQYWVKMILSGVTTSAGAKSNKKQIKKYMKQLNQKKLPPIDDNFDL
ncbi:MAG TPA: hypothetical protein PLJ13_07450 [Cyclobacteriaceae bacterium]|nr:hypothetical protein [Cyclobacteriaceae bacterium]